MLRGRLPQEIVDKKIQGKESMSYNRLGRSDGKKEISEFFSASSLTLKRFFLTKAKSKKGFFHINGCD